MNAKFAIRFVREWRRSQRKNALYHSKRQQLIQQVPNPQKLEPKHKSGRLLAVPTSLQKFNEWRNGNCTFTIIERSHPKLYRQLMFLHGWDGVMENHSGTAVAWKGNLESNSSAPTARKKLAITNTVLGGWDAFPIWYGHYNQASIDIEFLIYINSPVAPKEILQFAEAKPNVHLISWDFPHSRFKSHYINTYKFGHAQPAAIADAKFRALEMGCTHLLPIDLDEFIHPITQVEDAMGNRPCYFLSTFARNDPFSIGIGPQTLISTPESAQSHPQNQTGASGQQNKHAYGKSINPIHWDAHTPDNHGSGIHNPTDFVIHENACMLHFIEQEKTRSYPDSIELTSLKATNLERHIQEHRRLSDSHTLEYLLTAPKKFQ